MVFLCHVGCSREGCRIYNLELEIIYEVDAILKSRVFEMIKLKSVSSTTLVGSVVLLTKKRSCCEVALLKFPNSEDGPISPTAKHFKQGNGEYL